MKKEKRKLKRKDGVKGKMIKRNRKVQSMRITTTLKNKILKILKNSMQFQTSLKTYCM